MRDDDATLDDANATDEGRRGRARRTHRYFPLARLPLRASIARARSRTNVGRGRRPTRSIAPRSTWTSLGFHWLARGAPPTRRGRRRDVDGWMACGEGWGNAYRW